jgi:hypothetical protein
LATNEGVMRLGWRGGSHGEYLAEVRGLDAETVRTVRSELAKHQAANLQTRPEGLRIILGSWRNHGQGDVKTLDFILRYFENDRGSSQSNLTGMIGFCEQLLYDMGER